MSLVFKVEFLLLLVGGQREILKKLQNKMQFVLMKRHQSAPAYAAIPALSATEKLVFSCEQTFTASFLLVIRPSRGKPV